MIVATAGHIDHGKTALVKALTGADADRLPEEKARGLTIDLGFAYWRAGPGQAISFIDVPGHERFIKNMLAGVTGIDTALLVVAADDGPMPQTREHLAILDLLGVQHGIVAVTKMDRVAAERVQAVAEEVQALVEETVLAGSPVLPVSAITGAGVLELQRALQRLAGRERRRRASGRFRLAVDRSFTLRGVGLVVTGTAFSGTVKVGDRLLISPSGVEARVRAIHAGNVQAHAAQAGQRVALNLAGLRRHVVSRGDWLLAPEAHGPTRRIDIRLRVIGSEARPLRDRMPVHVHLGATDITGRVAVLDGSSIAPGEAGWAQLLLDREIGALAGDGVVLRDQSAMRTVAGGRVVDPFPPARGRARPERLAELAVRAGPDAFGGLVEMAPFGFDFARFARAHNLDDAEQAALRRRQGVAFAGPVAVDAARWQTLCDAFEREVDAWTAAHPDSPGLGPVALRRQLDPPPPRDIAEAALAALAGAGRLARSGGFVHRPGHRAALAPEEEALWQRIEPLVAEAGLRPPRVRELAEILRVDHNRVDRVLRQAGRFGLVRRVADNRWFPPAALRGLAAIAERLAAESADGYFTAAAYKDRAGIGRNVTIELLEFFDREGFTRREGDTRRIVRAWRG
ncbi:MAG: selenocysteine-specific translation elongation factor [Alphaproteobacteria bacterium]|nr:selenocysteine-specific translation elongation factor [Alphaproteobacteria bacterium]